MPLRNTYIDEEDKRDRESIALIQQDCYSGAITMEEMGARIDTIMDNARLRFHALMNKKAQDDYTQLFL